MAYKAMVQTASILAILAMQSIRNNPRTGHYSITTLGAILRAASAYSMDKIPSRTGGYLIRWPELHNIFVHRSTPPRVP